MFTRTLKASINAGIHFTVQSPCPMFRQSICSPWLRMEHGPTLVISAGQTVRRSQRNPNIAFRRCDNEGKRERDRQTGKKKEFRFIDVHSVNLHEFRRLLFFFVTMARPSERFNLTLFKQWTSRLFLGRSSRSSVAWKSWFASCNCFRLYRGNY